MIGWLALTPEQRKAAIDEAALNSGIPAKVIEKDWWVTLTLKALFQTPFAAHMVFKGGTSLSKCWQLIRRFSEDVDIALDPAAFGMEYRENPSRGQVNTLKKRGCEFTSTILKGALENAFAALGLAAGTLTVTAEEVPEDFTDKDPQTLFADYTSLYPANDYIADSVKIEVSVRSLKMPFSNRLVQTLLHEYNPNAAYPETPFEVPAMGPHKTFLEKAFLLHEEFGKPDRNRVRWKRMSRHLSDMYAIAPTEHGTSALTDHILYERIVHHRQWYSRISWVDYASLGSATLDFLPSADMMERYRGDYADMEEHMIYGEGVPTFDQVIMELKWLRGRFRLKQTPHTLEQVVQTARQQIGAQEVTAPGSHLTTVVTYLVNPDLPVGPTNAAGTYQVVFLSAGQIWQFESVVMG